MSRNPLEAGQKFNVVTFESPNDEETVAIPLKRGKSSTSEYLDAVKAAICRNPLEAGQKFNEDVVYDLIKKARVAIPLKRGKSSTIIAIAIKHLQDVAIPLKRGKSSTGSCFL